LLGKTARRGFIRTPKIHDFSRCMQKNDNEFEFTNYRTRLVGLRRRYIAIQ
jgi:hypothetical protein